MIRHNPEKPECSVGQVPTGREVLGLLPDYFAQAQAQAQTVKRQTFLPCIMFTMIFLLSVHLSLGAVVDVYSVLTQTLRPATRGR